jgi:hypothetical protein
MKCANPGCTAETLYFRSGSLPIMDRLEHGERGDSKTMRRIVWLCGECSAKLVVELWRAPGAQLQSRPAA